MSKRIPFYTVPFNAIYTAYLIGQIRARQGNRGLLLERLMVHLFRTLPGLRVSQRQQVKGGEVDLIVGNFGTVGQPLRWFGDYFFVECKDQQDSVDEKELGHFLTKMNLTKTTAGAIVSLKGLSGSPSYRWASRDRRLAYSQMGMIVLDVTLDDIALLGSSGHFVSMMQQKYEDLRFH